MEEYSSFIRVENAVPNTINGFSNKSKKDPEFYENEEILESIKDY